MPSYLIKGITPEVNGSERQYSIFQPSLIQTLSDRVESNTNLIYGEEFVVAGTYIVTHVTCLAVLSQEENAMGRFMKTRSAHDKTRAGKMMAAVGKSQSFAAQQR